MNSFTGEGIQTETGIPLLSMPKSFHLTPMSPTFEIHQPTLMSDVSSLVRCQPMHCRYRLTVKSLLGLYSLGLAVFEAKLNEEIGERN